MNRNMRRITICLKTPLTSRYINVYISGMKANVRVTLMSDDGDEFMGIGLVWLLQRIDRFRSIQKAARDMKLSYMKALNILNRLEKHVGQPVLLRFKGGVNRGGAELTPFGRSLMRHYLDLRQKMQAYAEKESDIILQLIKEGDGE